MMYPANTSERQQRRQGVDALGMSAGLVRQPDSHVHRTSVSALVAADSPRLQGENVAHTRMLATVESTLPPILVHRHSMTIIDGMHRLRAAKIRGDDEIEVEFFDGSQQEAFVLSVSANVAHGLPLSLADRTAAAERIVASHPMWSDRVIAATTGLGSRAVRSVRRKVEAQSQGGDRNRTRVGKDGRIRPLDNADPRRKACELLRMRPDASLREVARIVGASPSTVRDVRNRMRRGEDPVPPVRRKAAAPTPELTVEPDQAGSATAQLTSMLQGLASDPSLRFTESGRSLLRWIGLRVLLPGERQDVVGKVPPHCTYIVADVARRCAREWQQLAGDLEKVVQPERPEQVTGVPR